MKGGEWNSIYKTMNSQLSRRIKSHLYRPYIVTKPVGDDVMCPQLACVIAEHKNRRRKIHDRKLRENDRDLFWWGWQIPMRTETVCFRNKKTWTDRYSVLQINEIFLTNTCAIRECDVDTQLKHKSFLSLVRLERVWVWFWKEMYIQSVVIKKLEYFIKFNVFS